MKGIKQLYIIQQLKTTTKIKRNKTNQQSILNVQIEQKGGWMTSVKSIEMTHTARV